VPQRKILEGWLFEEGLTYEAALKRAKKEMGFTGSVSSLIRFYQRTAQERTLSGFAESSRLSSAIDGEAATAEQMQRSAVKVMAQWLLQKVTQSPDRVKDWAPVAKLLLHWDANELKDAENEVKRGWLEFAAEKAIYYDMEKALKDLPALLKIAERRKDPKQRRYEQNMRTNFLRHRLFGGDLPDYLPENEAEGEEIKKIEERKKERERLFAREIEDAKSKGMTAAEETRRRQDRHMRELEIAKEEYHRQWAQWEASHRGDAKAGDEEAVEEPSVDEDGNEQRTEETN